MLPKNLWQGKSCHHYVKQDIGGLPKSLTCMLLQNRKKAWELNMLVKMFTSSKSYQPTCKSPSIPDQKHRSKTFPKEQNNKPKFS